MYFKQITAKGLGCMSYLIGCPMSGKACVVDPRRDVQVYLDLARENSMKITHVFETHIHADHVSGNMEVKSRTGAEICLMEDSPATYEHRVVTEGEVFKFGNAKLQMIKTPGHTPHAMSILVTDLSRGEEPWLVLTGDCMFVGDVGRPDLAGGELLDEQVQNLYNSLYNKLGALPESMEIFPAHGEGSLCGMGMSSKLSSTIGFEKRNNHLLGLSNQEFTEAMTRQFPTRPRSFTHIISTNMEGPPLLDRCPVVKDLNPFQVRDEMEKGAVVLDTRDTASFGGVHIPGSINIGLAKQTANWIGMVIDPKAELILVVPDESAYDAMLVELHRIGYDNVIGYLYGGITAWQEEGLPISHLWQISPEKLKDKIEKARLKHFFDVRTPGEYQSGRIVHAENLPITELLSNPPDVPKDDEIIVNCAVGYRGNIAASFLQSQGFKHVHSLAGGLKAWVNSGYPVIR